MTSHRWTLRDFQEHPRDWERFEHGTFEASYKRYLDEQEAGDMERDEQQARFTKEDEQ